MGWRYMSHKKKKQIGIKCDHPRQYFLVNPRWPRIGDVVKKLTCFFVSWISQRLSDAGCCNSLQAKRKQSQSIPWLRMIWRRIKPVHQQISYWSAYNIDRLFNCTHGKYHYPVLFEIHLYRNHKAVENALILEIVFMTITLLKLLFGFFTE